MPCKDIEEEEEFFITITSTLKEEKSERKLMNKIR